MCVLICNDSTSCKRLEQAAYVALGILRGSWNQSSYRDVGVTYICKVRLSSGGASKEQWIWGELPFPQRHSLRHRLIMYKKSQSALECDPGSLPDPEGLRLNQKRDTSHTEQGSAAFGQLQGWEGARHPPLTNGEWDAAENSVAVKCYQKPAAVLYPGAALWVWWLHCTASTVDWLPLPRSITRGRRGGNCPDPCNSHFGKL